MSDCQVVNGQAITIITVNVLLSVLAILAVVLRFFARMYKRPNFYLDDYFVVLALILTPGVTSNNIIGVAVGGLGENEIYRTSGPAKDIGFPLAQELLYQARPSSVLAFYVRLFPTRPFKVGVYIVSSYVFCWWLSILFATIFQCHPISANWATEPEQLGLCNPNINILYEIAALSNMLGDVFVLALPFPVVFELHMRLKPKIAVLGIFITGALVVVAAIGRSVAYFKFDYNAGDSFSSFYYPLVVWTSVEPTLGVISACLPTLRPVFSGISPEILIGSIRSALSLHSYRGSSLSGGRTDSTNADDCQHLPSDTKITGSALSSRSKGAGSIRLPDPNGSSKENQTVAMELFERKQMQNGLPPKSIVVQEDVDQKGFQAHELDHRPTKVHEEV